MVLRYTASRFSKEEFIADWPIRLETRLLDISLVIRVGSKMFLAASGLPESPFALM
jgi:hypothetical protein